MSDPFPAQQPAYLGEWTFINLTTPPPATAQLRLNDGGQNKATLVYISNITFNGIDATEYLMGLIPGCSIKLENKNDPTKWQRYLVTGEPTPAASHVQLAVTWQAGGVNLAQLNVMLSTIAMTVRATGRAVTARVGNQTTSVATRVPISRTPALQTGIHGVDIRGQIYRPGMAFPSDTPAGFSPGMTVRQYYAAAALQGFIAHGIAHNLIGTVSDYAFKVADSMIAREAALAADKEAAAATATVTAAVHRIEAEAKAKARAEKLSITPLTPP